MLLPTPVLAATDGSDSAEFQNRQRPLLSRTAPSARPPVMRTQPQAVATKTDDDKKAATATRPTTTRRCQRRTSAIDRQRHAACRRADQRRGGHSAVGRCCARRTGQLRPTPMRQPGLHGRRGSAQRCRPDAARATATAAPTTTASSPRPAQHDRRKLRLGRDFPDRKNLHRVRRAADDGFGRPMIG